jgi:hypothetical protein
MAPRQVSDVEDLHGWKMRFFLGQGVSIDGPQLAVMKKEASQIPFDLLLLLTCLFRDGDMKALRPWLPFRPGTRWASGRVLRDRFGAFHHGDLETALEDLAAAIRDTGAEDPGRVLAIVLTDWEIMEVSVLEQILNVLWRIYPEVHLEAQRPSSVEAGTLDLILVAVGIGYRDQAFSAARERDRIWNKELNPRDLAEARQILVESRSELGAC